MTGTYSGSDVEPDWTAEFGNWPNALNRPTHNHNLDFTLTDTNVVRSSGRARLRVRATVRVMFRATVRFSATGLS